MCLRPALFSNLTSSAFKFERQAVQGRSWGKQQGYPDKYRITWNSHWKQEDLKVAISLRRCHCPKIYMSFQRIDFQMCCFIHVEIFSYITPPTGIKNFAWKKAVILNWIPLCFYIDQGKEITHTRFSFSTQIWHFCTKLTLKVSAKNKVVSSGNWTHHTNHQWIRSQMPIPLCHPDVLKRRSWNSTLFHVPLHFLELFPDSIEDDFIKVWQSETGKEWQIDRVGSTLNF